MGNDQDCQCGQPPYENGRLCPTCFAIHADEIRAKAEAGEIPMLEALARMAIAEGLLEQDTKETSDE